MGCHGLLSWTEIDIRQSYRSILKNGSYNFGVKGNLTITGEYRGVDIVLKMNVHHPKRSIRFYPRQGNGVIKKERGKYAVWKEGGWQEYKT